MFFLFYFYLLFQFILHSFSQNELQIRFHSLWFSFSWECFILIFSWQTMTRCGMFLLCHITFHVCFSSSSSSSSSFFFDFKRYHCWSIYHFANKIEMKMRQNIYCFNGMKSKCTHTQIYIFLRTHFTHINYTRQ